jgi:hypothetical protein
MVLSFPNTSPFRFLSQVKEAFTFPLGIRLAHLGDFSHGRPFGQELSEPGPDDIFIIIIIIEYYTRIYPSIRRYSNSSIIVVCIIGLPDTFSCSRVDVDIGLQQNTAPIGINNRLNGKTILGSPKTVSKII